MSATEAIDPAFRAVAEKAVIGGAGNMQPVGFADAANACFVAVKDGALDEAVADFGHGGGEILSAAVTCLHDAARAGALTFSGNADVTWQAQFGYVSRSARRGLVGLGRNSFRYWKPGG